MCVYGFGFGRGGIEWDGLAAMSAQWMSVRGHIHVHVAPVCVCMGLGVGLGLGLGLGSFSVSPCV